MESEYKNDNDDDDDEDDSVTTSPLSERDPLDPASDNDSTPDPPTSLKNDFIASKFELDELMRLGEMFAERMIWITRRSHPDGELVQNPRRLTIDFPGQWKVKVEVLLPEFDSDLTLMDVPV